MQWSEALDLTPKMQLVAYIVLGTAHGGKYDHKKKRWSTQPSVW